MRGLFSSRATKTGAHRSEKQGTIVTSDGGLTYRSQPQALTK
jgi:hypothetical protein